MDVVVTGHHMSVGESLTSYVKDKLQHVVKKYFDHATDASVVFLKSSHLIKCDIIVHDGTGRHTIIKSSASCDEPYSAYDISLAKSEKQLRKYKSKLKDRHHRMKMSDAAESVNYTIEPFKDDDYQFGDNPTIIAEKPVYVEHLTVEEAVMKMDLENLPAVMFKNIKNGRINMIYYRNDGNIAWVDNRSE